MKTFTLFLCSCFIAVALQAQIIHVPDDFPTIQLGINAANPGDTVLVSEGTYFEQINFLGKKPLMVASQFLMDGDTNHIASTIINGSQLPDPDSASVVYFVSGEDTTSILCGFTITGGSGTTIYTPEWMWGVAREGGGIWVSGAGVKIKNNIITRNICEDINLPAIRSDVGGGIASDPDFNDFWIVIEDNVIDSNYVISDSPAGCCTGGGIAIFSNCRIINNIIKNNVGKILVNTVWWSQGSGACIFSADSLGNSLNKVAIIQNNLFLNNSNNSNNAYGGGMKVMNVHLTCTHNTFIGNRVESDISITDCWGAGMEAGNFLEGSVISGNTFKDNYSEKTDAGLLLFSWNLSFKTVVVENNYFFNNIAESIGGAFGVYDCKVRFENNIFNGNEAGSAAVGHITSTSPQTGHTAWLINNTFSNNKATGICGSIQAVRAHPLILNCIFWENSANLVANELWSSNGGEFEIAYSDIDITQISGSFIAGAGIINMDPLFIDTVNLVIGDMSPCVNAGQEDYICACGDTTCCSHYDLNGIGRPQNGGFDIGAYEVMFAGIPSPGSQQSAVSIFPNPFSDYTTFEYELEESGVVTLMIFSQLGHEVIVLVNENQTKGKHQVQWNAEGLPSGIYFYRLTVDGQRPAMGKLVKY
jgi:hypothetical protein